MTAVEQVTLVILDSVGVGAMPDAGLYDDDGSNTLVNTAQAVGGLHMPNMGRLGLGNIVPVEGVTPVDKPAAARGRMAERSPGKDTTTGHWEMAGLILERPFPVYPDGFPPEIISAYEARIGRPVLGNKAASGTVIIEELGRKHIETGYPIVYTSADSVFQVAAHEEVIPAEDLYEMCRQAREMLVGKHAVGRVIARPFTGRPGSFRRTERRHDFSLKPPRPTILNVLHNNGVPVTAVGKVEDIFAGSGITRSFPVKGNKYCMDVTVELVRRRTRGLVFTNLVDFDMLYGHRNDPRGFADALEEFDRRLPELISVMQEADVLIITADHGCDPTTSSTDHSREYVPLLVYGKQVQGGVNLGVRETFADVAATLADFFAVPFSIGRSFAEELKQE